MSEADDADAAVGKAGRNEARKLRGAWLNTVSAAFFVAAVIQPVIGVVQQQRLLALVALFASLMFFTVSLGAFLWAQSIVRGMED